MNIGQLGQFAARELINYGWTTLAFCIFLIFGGYLLGQVRSDRYWYRQPGNKAALALFVYFIGETIARGWTTALLWSARHIVQHPHFAAAVKENYEIALIGASISLVGALCCIRIFSPARWGPWPWLVSAALAITVAVTIAST